MYEKLKINSKDRIKVAVGMSGGVDSSVSALLLKQQGYDVVGLFMKLWHDPCGTGQNACCDEKALADAHAVAQKIGIPLYVVDVRKEFKKAVTDYFIDEYKSLRTPNPCVVCNKEIKFGWLLKFAQKIGCEYLATGHYARISNSSDLPFTNFQCSLNDHLSNGQMNEQCSMKNGKFRLFKAKDEKKDQSYFLYRLSQDQLRHIIFPIGEMTKPEVRALAKQNNLPVHEKKESQEICFVEDDYRSFLKRNLGATALKTGEIIDEKGNIIGTHEGLINYTIGQRKGIDQKTEDRIQKTGNITQRTEKKPLYVLGFDHMKNQLIVGEDKELFKTEFVVKDVHWINDFRQETTKDLAVKIRYKSEAVPCETLQISNTKIKIMLDHPTRALTPGQSAVFYRDDEIIGGGIIEG